LQNVVRDIILIVITLLSLKLTANNVREANSFTWFPIVEVAKLFAGIFITIIPAIAILKAGQNGSLAFIINLVTDQSTKLPINSMYFWLTGILSSFLDNAPTYVVFFEAVGINSEIINSAISPDMTKQLLAISMGAVFMGALTYIGNAPNFMVKSIAESSGIKMPSFFGYFVYSLAILFPLFFIVGIIFF